IAPLLAHAQGAVQNSNAGSNLTPQAGGCGGDSNNCPGDQICGAQNSCIPGNLPDGSACTQDEQCTSANGCSGGVCGGSSASSAAPGATGAPSASGASSGFVPLAPIPGLTSAQSNVTSSTIAGFLNNLYKYLIGIAAVLAVIVIIRGGLEIAGESVTKKAEGRQHIQQAILGLVLVLAPALVFTIINPAILNLSLSLPPLSIEAPGSGSAANNPAPINQNIACSSANGQTDCSQAQQSCSALTNGGSSGSAICLKSGVQDTAQPYPNNSEEGSLANSGLGYCPVGDTITLQCQGAAAVNGASQAGLTPQQIAAGATPLFDGTYMDLIKYIGSGAQQKATAYTCQSSSQTKSIFSNTDQTNWYAMCLTPKITSLEESTTETGSLNNASQKDADTYNGECKAVSSAQKTEGFGGLQMVEYQPVSPLQRAACTTTTPPGPLTSMCLEFYSTCMP
ncbi:MAG: pilin, partial [Minisyncoccia bacterium]